MPETDFDWRPGALIIALVCAILVATKLPDITAGILPGPDDSMRLQQVRDLLAGQSWYTVDQARLITPEGGAMHWSRMPDLFLAAMIATLSPLIGQTGAEQVAVALWPVLLLVVSLTALVRISRHLGMGSAGAVLGILIFVTSKSVFAFWPGRIDHHGAEIALVLVALSALVTPSGGRRSGLVAGASVAVMVGIAIESLPYAGMLIAGAGVLWILRGEAEQARLAGLGVGAGGASVLIYVLDAPGPGAARAVCDAFGNFHLAGLVIGSGLLFALASVSTRLAHWQARAGAAALCGALTLAGAGLVAPHCLGSPYADVNAQAAQMWLVNVSEARSLLALAKDTPAAALGDIGFLLGGLVCGVVAIAKAPPRLRPAWGLVLALLVTAILVTSWQIRAVVFAHALATIPAGWAAGIMFRRWRRRRGVPALLGFAAVILLLAPGNWRIAAKATLGEVETEATAQTEDQSRACTTPQAQAALAERPAARVFAPIDLGASIIANTPHSVLNAPYHRNDEGIARAMGIFRASPEEAHARLQSLEADYLVDCPGGNAVETHARHAPDSLAARLQANKVPAWLEPLDLPHDDAAPIKVYRIAAPGPRA